MPPQHAASRDVAVREITRLPEEVPALFWIKQIAVVHRRWKVLAGSVAAGVVLALSISALQPRLYHAKTSVEIQPVSEDLLKSPVTNGDAVQPPDIQTQIKIIESAAVSGSSRVRLIKVTDDVVRSLSVHPAGQTRIIEIEADGRSPQVASDYVNAVAEAYIARHLEAGEQTSGVLTARLGIAINDLRTRLEISDTALQSYARESGIILTPDQSSVAEERLRQIQDALSRAEADRVQKQARSEAISQTGVADLASVLNDPSIKSGQEKLADLQRQRAELSVIYTPDYAKVKRLDAQIDSVGSAVRSQIADASGRIRSEYEESRRREAMLGDSYQTQRAAVLEEGGKRVHYAVLKSEADSTRALYDTMLSRVKETGIAFAMRDTNVRVLDRAIPARTPFQPRLAQALLMGAIAGLLIGLFITHNLEESDRAIRTLGELAALSHGVALGALSLGTQQGPAKGGMRAIVASLLLARDAAKRRAFVITSALPGEGKTLVTAELGEAFARMGKRVLIIDGDISQPDLTSRLAVTNTRGFGDLLGFNRPLDVIAIAPAITATVIPNLHVLSVGAMPAYSPDLLHTARLPEILSYGRKNFDIVLVDTPPVLQTPDARMIARAADAVILVVRAGRATKESVLAAIQVFAEDGTPMAGTILNDCKQRQHNQQLTTAPYGGVAGSMRTPGNSAAKRAAA